MKWLKVSSALGFLAAALLLFYGISNIQNDGVLHLAVAITLAGVGMAAVAYGIYAEPKHHRLLGVLMFAASFVPVLYAGGWTSIAAFLGVGSAILAIMADGSLPAEEEDIGHDAAGDHQHH